LQIANIKLQNEKWMACLEKLAFCSLQFSFYNEI